VLKCTFITFMPTAARNMADSTSLGKRVGAASSLRRYRYVWFSITPQATITTAHLLRIGDRTQTGRAVSLALTELAVETIMRGGH
jgi:hypothetical protein